MDHKQKLSTAVVNAIKTDDGVGLLKDYAELGIDSFLESGGLKDIPIVSTLFAIVRAGSSIHNQIFANKIIRFIFALTDLSMSERREMGV